MSAGARLQDRSTPGTFGSWAGEAALFSAGDDGMIRVARMNASQKPRPPTQPINIQPPDAF
jgi:hypothetical protein